jgi:hypothetical protein
MDRTRCQDPDRAVAGRAAGDRAVAGGGDAVRGIAGGGVAGAG